MKTNKKTVYIAVIFIIIGFLIFLYPTIANFLTNLNQVEVIRQYNKKVQSLEEKTLKEEYQKAINYNLGLINNENKETDENEYLSILNVNSDGIIGEIEIPKINMKIPIYHGTSSEVIEKGAGHISKSAFPIEGESVHSVLTSHTGLSKAKLFTELDKMKLNDIFYITVLDKRFCYKVCDIKTVLPDEIDVLKIVENENLCTLVTCTPYGVNTHRLLVTGKFTTYQEPQKETVVEKEAKDDRNFILIQLIFVITLLIVIFTIIKHKKTKKR